MSRAAAAPVAVHTPSLAVARDEAREIALSMPEAVEQDHHRRPSFRVHGKIAATLWSDEQMNVMLDEGGILTAVAEAPGSCREVWLGEAAARSRDSIATR